MSDDSKVPDGVYLRGVRWWVSYYGPDPKKGGVWGQIREPAKREKDGKPARTPKEAEKYRDARLEEIAMHRRGVQAFQGPQTERIPFKDLLDEYQRAADRHGLRSLPQIRSRVKRIAAAFAGYRALAVTDDAISNYVEQRQRDGAAPATINRELEVIGRAFALAKRKLRFTPSIPSLPERNARQGFFDRADFERVLSYIDDADVVDFLEWFYLTGMRPNEIRSLTWAAYDRETSMLTLPGKDAKTGQPRTLPVRAKLRPIVERRVKARRIHHADGRESLAEYIFHRGGQRIGEFRKTWATACEKAGLADIQGEGRTRKVRPLKLVYDLRRTAIRNAVRAGVDPAVVMRISGHRTRAVFDRYNIIDERDLAAAIERTSAYVETLPTSSNVVPLRTEAERRP